MLLIILQEVSRPSGSPAAVGPPSDPVMARTLSTLAERSVDERFEVGLGLILDGLGLPAQR